MSVIPCVPAENTESLIDIKKINTLEKNLKRISAEEVYR